jgi:ribose transport system ATP-binding protein
MLELRGYSAPGVGPLDLSLDRGEILAVFGLLGSGRTELLEGIFGIQRMTTGELRLRGQQFRPRSPADALRKGVALVAGDRLRQSMLPAMSALDNVMLPHQRKLARFGARRKRRERAEFRSVAGRMRVEPPRADARAWTFSGGNQQKLAVGRWLTRAAGVDVLLLDEPTQGIDVGAREDLYGVLEDLARREGKAVLFTSSDPEEVEAIADRVIVLRNGRAVASQPNAGIGEQRLLALAHGADAHE